LKWDHWVLGAFQDFGFPQFWVGLKFDPRGLGFHNLGSNWNCIFGLGFHYLVYNWSWIPGFGILLPEANGQTCVDFGCTHSIDGLFWNLPIYLLGFFLKYQCWEIDLIMPLYHFIFLVVTCLYVKWGFI
jgi:hypothetical protein